MWAIFMLNELGIKVQHELKIDWFNLLILLFFSALVVRCHLRNQVRRKRGEGVRGVNGNRKDETESRSPPPLLSSCVTFQAWGDVFQSMVKWTLFKCWWRNFQWKNRKDETRSRSTLNPLFFLKHIPGQGKNPFHRKRENQHLYNEHLTIDWKTKLQHMSHCCCCKWSDHTVPVWRICALCLCFCESSHIERYFALSYDNRNTVFKGLAISEEISEEIFLDGFHKLAEKVAGK